MPLIDWMTAETLCVRATYISQLATKVYGQTQQTPPQQWLAAPRCEAAAAKTFCLWHSSAWLRYRRQHLASPR